MKKPFSRHIQCHVHLENASFKIVHYKYIQDVWNSNGLKEKLFVCYVILKCAWPLLKTIKLVQLTKYMVQ